MSILTICHFLPFLDSRSPPSPSAEKKRKQWLNMSQQQKEAQREKSKLAMMQKMPGQN
jgi:hypothetical protein